MVFHQKMDFFEKLCFSVQFFGNVLFPMYSVTSLVKVEVGLTPLY